MNEKRKTMAYFLKESSIEKIKSVSGPGKDIKMNEFVEYCIDLGYAEIIKKIEAKREADRKFFETFKRK
jgi:hypothetical protein